MLRASMRPEASGPILTFASRLGRHVCKCQNQRTTSKIKLLVELLDLTFAWSARGNWGANVKSAPLGESLIPNHCESGNALMNPWFVLSGLFSLITAVIHVFLGGPEIHDVVQAASELPSLIRSVCAVIWHAVTAILIINGVLMILAAFIDKLIPALTRSAGNSISVETKI